MRNDESLSHHDQLVAQCNITSRCGVSMAMVRRIRPHPFLQQPNIWRSRRLASESVQRVRRTHPEFHAAGIFEPECLCDDVTRHRVVESGNALLTPEQVNALLRHRPAVHHLCAGSWIQMPFEMGEDVLGVPLRPLGFAAEIGYLARYTREIVRAAVDDDAVRGLLQATTESQPIVALCLRMSVDSPAEVLEEAAKDRLDRARHVLAWTSGRSVTLVGVVVATTEATFFRPVAPPFRNRQQLFGIGGSAAEYQQTLLKVASRARVDERFAFALSLYHDAVREESAQFRIARFFNVLEALASGLKAKSSSRQAVKRLLGLADGATVQMRYENEDYRFDGIEIAGRIRDKVFHGTSFRESDLNEISRPVFGLVCAHPTDLADIVAGYCELELSRWANGTSLGQVASAPGA